MMGVFRHFGDKVCNKKIGKRSVWLLKQIAKTCTLLISSSFTKVDTGGEVTPPSQAACFMTRLKGEVVEAK
jgi:hypothetical protein